MTSPRWSGCRNQSPTGFSSSASNRSSVQPAFSSDGGRAWHTTGAFAPPAHTLGFQCTSTSMPRMPRRSWSTSDTCWLLSLFDSDGGLFDAVLKELCVPTHMASRSGSASPRRCCSSRACPSQLDSWAATACSVCPCACCVCASTLVVVLSTNTHTRPDGSGDWPGGHGGSPAAAAAGAVTVIAPSSPSRTPTESARERRCISGVSPPMAIRPSESDITGISRARSPRLRCRLDG